MYKKNPIISVGLPVYNGEKYIESSIKSVLDQSFSDFELIISDNASTDGTEEICREFQRQDNRIRYHRNPENLGAGLNYNIVFSKAIGKFFRWHNADDLALLDLHRLCLESLQKNEDAVLSYGKTNIIDENGTFLREYNDDLDLRSNSPKERFIHFMKVRGWTNVIYGLMRKSAMEKTALFGNFQASDYNFIGELCLYGKFIEIPTILFLRRIHPDANTWSPEDKEVQQKFWDPKNKKFTHQAIKQHIAYYKAVLRAPIPIFEKIQLSKYLLHQSYWEKNELWQDFLSSFKS